MIRIKLSRKGKKNDPVYRIVVIDKSRKISGKPISTIGYWHPATKTKMIDTKKLQKWIKLGAGMTGAVKELYEKAS